MEWSDVSMDEDLYGLLSNPSEWSREENKLFENALAEMDPSSPGFLEYVAAKLPWKTIEEIKLHYEALVNDVDMIESGNFPIPDYPPLDFDDAEDYETETESESESESEPKPEPDPEPEPEPQDVKGKCKRPKRTKSGQPRRKGVPWTKDEHQLFLMGLNKYGKGDWRSISRYYVLTKSTSQVASHAQKYFRRRTSSTPAERRRPSIHDIHTINPPSTRPIPPFSSCTPLLHSFNVSAAPILQQNPSFMPPLPLNSGFPSAAAHPVFNQMAPAYSYASTSSSCFFNSPNWG